MSACNDSRLFYGTVTATVCNSLTQPVHCTLRECFLSFGAESFVFQSAIQNIKIKIYRTVILSVLYECETWSVTLREEHRLRVFSNRVLRRIFGPKRDGVTGEWRKLHNEELHTLYASQNIIWAIKSRRMRWGRNAACMDDREVTYRVLVGRLDGKRPLWRPKRR